MRKKHAYEREDLGQCAVRECHLLARGGISCAVPIILCLTQQHAVRFDLQSSFRLLIIYFTHECIAMHIYDDVTFVLTTFPAPLRFFV